MNIPKEELRKFEGNYEWYKNAGEGYRIVYFYEDGHYYIGAYSKTIEGFMINFAATDPIEDESDIPEFISNEDLLERYLNNLPNIIMVAIYKTDGTCVQTKKRNNVISK